MVSNQPSAAKTVLNEIGFLYASGRTLRAVASEVVHGGRAGRWVGDRGSQTLLCLLPFPPGPWGATNTATLAGNVLGTYLSILLASLVFNHSGKVDQSPEGCHGSCPTKKSGTMVL